VQSVEDGQSVEAEFAGLEGEKPSEEARGAVSPPKHRWDARVWWFNRHEQTELPRSGKQSVLQAEMSTADEVEPGVLYQRGGVSCTDCVPIWRL
jgi:hypothetical protein